MTQSDDGANATAAPPHGPHDAHGHAPAVDPHLNDAGRAGLTGTAPASHYAALPVRDQVTIAPDGRPHDVQPQWRQDFPIDWPQDQYVARRDFTKFLALTSFAFVVGQVSIGVRDALGRRRASDPFAPRRIAATSDVPVGGSIVFDYPDEHEPCLLIRPASDEWLAYSQTCTHLSCAVVPRVAENCIHCPCHNGFFDLRSGRPIAGPPRRPLPRIRLEVRQGEVFATGVERSTV